MGLMPLLEETGAMIKAHAKAILDSGFWILDSF